MSRKPTYEELETRVRELERKLGEFDRLGGGGETEPRHGQGPPALALRGHIDEADSEAVCDVSVRKRAENIMKEETALYAALMDKSRDGIAIIDQDHKMVESNRRFAEMLGYTREEALQLHTWDWEASMTEAEIRESFADLAETYKLFETRHRRKDGTFFDVEVSASGAKVGEGNLVFTISRDIGDRKAAERALKEQYEFLQTLIDAIPVSVFYKNIDGIYTGCNQAFAGFVGRTKEKVVGKTVYEICPKDLADVYNEADKKLFENPGTQYYETQVEHSDGTRRDVFFNKATFYRDGTVAGLIGVMVDITERKNAEKIRAELEAKLRQSHKMEAIGTLAGGIAHDFNNTLGIIVGNIELAADDVPEWNPACEFLEEARKGCLRARDMVKRILAFSRREKVERVPVNIVPVAKEALKMLRDSIPSNIKVLWNPLPKEVYVMAVPTQIQQVLMNLCANAAHAMENKDGVLRVDLATVEIGGNSERNPPGLKPGPYVRLTVGDTGHGIAEEIVEKVFDPYFTTKEVGKGTGMGLAVVHGIVEDHGGAVTVQSQAGKGTTFDVFLPAAGKKGGIEEIKSGKPRTGKERVLFVDDEIALAKMACRLLEGLGYRAVCFTDGIEALEAFQKNPHAFDLVITDMTMPRITGDELAIRMMRIRPDIPVILCTGYSCKMDEEKTRLIGIKGFSQKPFVKNDLAETIRRALDF